MRMVISHGDPRTGHYFKLQHYKGVAKAMAHIRRQDEAMGAPRREVIWMADHNMVCAPAEDELRGTAAPGGARHAELCQAVEEAMEEMDQGGMQDALHALMPGQTHAYTHKVRRIDRAVGSAALYDDTKWPRLVAFRHIEQEDLQVVAPAPNGVHKVYTPGHKAVEVTLRRSEDARQEGGWSCTRRKARSDEEWAGLEAELEAAVHDRARVRCETEGGEVRVRIQVHNAEERFEKWRTAATEYLKECDRAARKERGRRMTMLRRSRDEMVGRAQKEAAAGRTSKALSLIHI